MRRRPAHHLHLVGRQHSDGGRFPTTGRVVQRGEHTAGREPAHLEVRRDAHTEVRGGPRGPTALLLGATLLVAAQLERLVERPLVVAAVVGQPGHCGVRELRGLDHVAAPDLDGVEADLRRQGVHRSLDRVRRFRTSRASVRVGGRHRREHRSTAERVIRHVVDTGVEKRPEQRDAGSDQLEIRTHVGDEIDADRRDLALGVGGEIDLLDLPAPLDRRLRALGALLDPANRHPVLAGERDTDQLFRINVQLGPEPSTHRGSDHTHLMLGNAERERDHDLEDVRDLRGRVEGDVAAERLRHRGHRPGLHRHRDEPLLDVALADRVCRGSERGVDRLLTLGVQLPRVALVGAQTLVDHHAVAERILQIDHRGQRLVVDDDRVERVARLGVRLRDDHGNRVTRIAGLVDRDREVLGRLHVGRDGPRARHRARPQVAQIGPGVHRHDTRHARSGRRVDAGDARVGVRAAREGDRQGARDGEVVGVLRLAREQRRVFLAEQPRADETGGRGLHCGHASTA